jgi:hypothetical protein
MSSDAVHPDPTIGPASAVVPPRRDLEALSLLSTDHHLAHTAEALAERFAGVFTPETVAACLMDPPSCSPTPRRSRPT